MKKELIKRCLLGAPLGLAISTVITILISLIVGDGRYYAVVPQLVRRERDAADSGSGDGRRAVGVPGDGRGSGLVLVLVDDDRAGLIRVDVARDRGRRGRRSHCHCASHREGESPGTGRRAP